MQIQRIEIEKENIYGNTASIMFSADVLEFECSQESSKRGIVFRASFGGIRGRIRKITVMCHSERSGIMLCQNLRGKECSVSCNEIPIRTLPETRRVGGIPHTYWRGPTATIETRAHVAIGYDPPDFNVTYEIQIEADRTPGFVRADMPKDDCYYCSVAVALR